MLHDKMKNLFILKRIVSGWNHRARIHSSQPDLEFLPEKDDFIETLLPFYGHPLCDKFDEIQRRNCLSCGWIIYNEKTLFIENDIVSPACKNIMNGQIPGLIAGDIRLAACETMIDESYHMLLVEKANQITKTYRNLHYVQYPPFHIINQIEKACDNSSEAWMKPILQMAIATVTEVLITEYLLQLSSCEYIQPMNRWVVNTHMNDECAHKTIFSVFLNQFYHILSKKQKRFFASSIANAMCWFNNPELHIWEAVLEQLKIPQYKTIIRDCDSIDQIKNTSIDYSELIKLLEINEIFEDDYNCGLFYDRKLI